MIAKKGWLTLDSDTGVQFVSRKIKYGSILENLRSPGRPACSDRVMGKTKSQLLVRSCVLTQRSALSGAEHHPALVLCIGEKRGR